MGWFALGCPILVKKFAQQIYCLKCNHKVMYQFLAFFSAILISRNELQGSHRPLYKSKKNPPKYPLWVLYTCGSGCLTTCKRRKINLFILGWENVQKVVKTGHKPNLPFLTTFWTFSQPRMNGLIFRLLNVVRHPETQV